LLRPPRPPLFPYTTLFRSSSALRACRTRKLICAFHSPIVWLSTSRNGDKQRKQCLSTLVAHTHCERRRHNNDTTSARCFIADFLDRKSTRLNSSHRTISYA